MAGAFDAIVVGSGATGGWAAKELTEAGLRVALLEAGPLAPPVASPSNSLSAARRQQVQARCYAFGEETAHLFVDDLDNPYECPEDAPFAWIRSRVVGGRLHTWGRTSVRMSDRDFTAADSDGIGEAWPISYADLAPHYNRVERFLGVCGSAAGAEQMPDGCFAEPPPLSSAERAFAARVERCWPTRTVTPTRIARTPAGALIEAAEATGRLTLLADSIASRVIVERGGGRAAGVAFVGRVNRREEEVRAPVVVLCASTIESTRLLLNSASDEHPRGLGNSSGVLGRYLMDHTYGVGIDGLAPWRWRPGGGRSSYGCLVPAFRNVTEPGPSFTRTYGVELQIEAPPGGRLASVRGRRSGPAWMRAFGEVLPRFENHIAIDPGKVDAWGIPVVRINCRYGENERQMAADQHRCLEEMAELAGWEVERSEAELGPPGLSVHEIGTARMGANPQTSVLDPHNSCWDVPNLFVTDGACFTSGGSQNPTLTMMAITVRACGFIVERLRRGEL
jgi:choline dehydrogenase-like flavoprotein